MLAKDVAIGGEFMSQGERHRRVSMPYPALRLGRPLDQHIFALQLATDTIVAIQNENKVEAA